MVASRERKRDGACRDPRESAAAGKVVSGFGSHAPECGEAAATFQVSRLLV